MSDPKPDSVKLYACPVHGVLPRWQGGPFCGKSVMGGHCERRPKPVEYVSASDAEWQVLSDRELPADPDDWCGAEIAAYDRGYAFAVAEAAGDVS